MEGISIWQLVILALIILLLFGTKKLRTIGTDLGQAIRGFRKAVNHKEEEAHTNESATQEVVVNDKKQ